MGKIISERLAAPDDPIYDEPARSYRPGPRRRHAPAQGPSQWHITVLDAEGIEILWHGSTLDRDELTALAIEARRLRPEAKILIRHPMGATHYWE